MGLLVNRSLPHNFDTVFRWDNIHPQPYNTVPKKSITAPLIRRPISPFLNGLNYRDSSHYTWCLNRPHQIKIAQLKTKSQTYMLADHPCKTPRIQHILCGAGMHICVIICISLYSDLAERHQPNACDVLIKIGEWETAAVVAIIRIGAVAVHFSANNCRIDTLTNWCCGKAAECSCITRQRHPLLGWGWLCGRMGHGELMWIMCWTGLWWVDNAYV